MLKTDTSKEIRLARIHYWTPHIESWQTSGQSIKSYCKEHELIASQFQYWKKIIVTDSKQKNIKQCPSDDALSFIKLNSTKVNSTSQTTLRIVFSNKTELVLCQPLTSDFLETLIPLLYENRA